ncbi:MAG: rod shape-determining protein RodA [Candidatus Paceibacterota bacterium]
MLKKTIYSLKELDWVLFFATVLVVSLGLITMHSFSGDDPYFFRHLIVIALSFFVFFGISLMNLRFLRRTGFVVILFLLMTLALIGMLLFGEVTQGTQRWVSIGPFSLQLSELAKLVLVILLAKYFSKRHVEIASFRHIFISGVYAIIFFILIFLQPDLGSAVIIFLIWLGMIMVSGVSLKHLGVVFLIGVMAFAAMWSFALQDYQKERVISFIKPYADVEGSGYHTRQSVIAIGSGEMFGKGIGYGTQSQLRFLPEHHTDFIFAAFAEEWGFVGMALLFFLYGVIIWRLLVNAQKGETNFETLFGIGLVVILISHIVIHAGANLGMMPVTGTTLPFMSFGGSHTITTFAALGMFMAMRRYQRITSKEVIREEVTVT